MRTRLQVWAVLTALVLVGWVSQAGAQDSVDDPAQVEAGQAVYAASCAGCHGEDGTGVEGRGRPLTDIASQGERAQHIMSITEGTGFMPAFGEQLSGEEIEAAASYVRLTFVSEEAASSEELADTGVETAPLAVGGITLIAAGMMIVRSVRTRDD